MLMTLHRALDRETYQFDYLEFSPDESHYSGEIRALGGRLLKCDWSQSPLAIGNTVRELSAIIQREGPFEAIHSHVLLASGTVLFAAKLADVNVRVAHSHSTRTSNQGAHVDLYAIAARALIARSATRLAACSIDAGYYLFGPRAFNRSGVVIPNAVDTSCFTPPSQRERVAAREALGLAKSRLTLVSIARLEPVKNHEFLIEVANALESRGVDFDMLFVGDGQLRPALEAAIATHNLQHRIRLLGVREDVDVVLRAADALLLPSFFEGLPVSLVEAQATGVTCLVSDRVTRDADFGLDLLRYLPIDDPGIWADSIASAGHHRLSAADTASALERKGYGVESALDKMLALYSTR